MHNHIGGGDSLLWVKKYCVASPTPYRYRSARNNSARPLRLHVVKHNSCSRDCERHWLEWAIEMSREADSKHWTMHIENKYDCQPNGAQCPLCAIRPWKLLPPSRNYVLPGVCLSVNKLHIRNYWSDLHENFTRTWNSPLNVGSHSDLDPDIRLFKGIFTLWDTITNLKRDRVSRW